MLRLLPRFDASTPDGCQVVTVWGASGAPGRSSVAANLACELAVAGQQVLLIDADTHAPMLAEYFSATGQAPGLAAAARIIDQDRLDLEQLNRLSLQLSLGRKSVNFLSGISNAARWSELQPRHLDAVLALARDHFDFVVIDVADSLEQNLIEPHGSLERNALGRHAIQAADSVVGVVAADPISVSRFIGSLRDLPSGVDPLVVVNRFRESALGSKPRNQLVDAFARLTRLDICAFIPDEPAVFDASLLHNLPLALGKRSSAARVAISQFARLHLLKERSDLDRRVAKLG